MNTPKISVIVPVYNVEQYLSRCIDSILAQTFIDFELLLIDDGSKDNSGNICDKYAEKDHRIRVFHKENGGVSSARNIGIDNARGEWIYFSDSDDYVHRDIFYKLIEPLHNQKFNLIIFSFINGKTDVVFPNKANNLIETIKELNDRPYCSCGYLWHKIFKKELIKELRFDTNLSYGEDAVFFFDYLTQVNTKIYFSSQIGYTYTTNIQSSLCHKRHSINEIILLLLSLKRIIISLIKNNKATSYLYNYYNSKIIQFLYDGIRESDSFAKSFYYSMKSQIKNIEIKQYSELTVNTFLIKAMKYLNFRFYKILLILIKFINNR